MTTLQFPKDFLWGAATAAYQVEGAAGEGGRGESIWDRFSHTPGKVARGETGDRACDHYHRVAEDVALMAGLGLGAYRFSVAWPRIQPEGRGAPNRAGLDFYSGLLDALIAAGITPMLTLYHWDLPQALEERGGWANRDIAGRFADYAAIVARELGDRVPLWVTLNEPQVFTTLGYLLGEHAPGDRNPGRAFAATHHANLAHGAAVEAIRAEAPASAQVGTVLQLPPVDPLSDSDEDRRAAGRIDALFNRWFAEPVLLGRYPEELLAELRPLLPLEEGDLRRIQKPLDFVGLNVYTRLLARHHPGVPLVQAMVDLDRRVPGARYNAMGWEVYPQAIYRALLRFKEQWGDPPVYVTENGTAEEDVLLAGRVEDPLRVAYLRDYLAQVHRAMEAGVKVRGYFVWSLLDNFEWSLGYDKRFGLVHVDHAQDLRRTPKASARWYSRLIATGRLELAE